MRTHESPEPPLRLQPNGFMKVEDGELVPLGTHRARQRHNGSVDPLVVIEAFQPTGHRKLTLGMGPSLT